MKVLDGTQYRDVLDSALAQRVFCQPREGRFRKVETPSPAQRASRTMAFWNLGSSIQSVSAVDKVLEKPEHTLEDVLDAGDLIQQLQDPSLRLVEYLCQTDVILQLVEYVVNDGTTSVENEGGSAEGSAADREQGSRDETGDEHREEGESPLDDNESTDEDSRSDFLQIGYPKLAAHILSANIWDVLDALVSNEEAMRRLFDILDSEEEASPQQLSNFTRIVENLLERRLEVTVEFIKTLPRFVDHFIKYVDNPPLIDFLLKVISTDHPDSPSDVIDMLYDQQLVPKMIALLKPEVSNSRQTAAGDFLKALVTISGGNKAEACSIGPNELTRQFVSEPCISELVRIMLCGGSGMCIAVGVIIEIIRKNNTDYDYVQVLSTTLQSHPPNPRDSIHLGSLVKAFAKAIPEFQAMLTREHTETMQMPFGTIQPLGFERFRICELYAELLHCSNMGLLNDVHGEEIVSLRDSERQRRFHHGSKTNASTDAATAQNTPADSSPGNASPEAFAPVPEEEQKSPELSSSDEEDANRTVSLDGAESPPFYQTVDSFNEDEDAIQSQAVGDLEGPELERALEEKERTIRERPLIGDQLKLALNDNGCIKTVFSMLFEFPWNNFLHNVVFDIVQQIFNGAMNATYNKFLAIHLFTEEHITSFIVRGQRANDEYEKAHNIRLGYVGHLTLISEEVVKFSGSYPPYLVSPKLVEAFEDPEWNEYVQNSLLKLREQYNQLLGGRHEQVDGIEVVTVGDTDEEEDVDDGLGSRPIDFDDDSEGFQRYMSRELSGSLTNLGSSDEEDEDEAWVPVPDREHQYKDSEEHDSDEGESNDLGK